MTASLLARWGAFLREQQRAVLLALLGVLHLTLLAGVGSPIGLTCWLVDVGLFILWQPFMQTERRLGGASLALFAVMLGAGAWLFSWWLLIFWAVMLAALLGGRVLMLGHRPTRLFYLAAFAYLLLALLVFLVPKVVPGALPPDVQLDRPFALGAPALFVLMLVLPRPRAVRLAGAGGVDFFYSLFVGLLIGVLILGSLAFVVIRQTSYLEALFGTLLTLAAMLLLMAWAWNPRPGFGGLGVLLSRYLLSFGLPFDVWLQRLMDCAERESKPERFLRAATGSLRALPWFVGVRWRAAASADGRAQESGALGATSAYSEELPGRPLEFTLYTRHALGPALLWHFRLLAELSNEFYLAKQRAQELERMSYLRAVHETGARLTHDVKNLLQSLDNLCFMAQSDEATLQAGVRRQLPQLAARLRQTLDKLQVSPEAAALPESAETVAAALWWAGLRERFAQPWIEFVPLADDGAVALPRAVFDGVADNLLDNARLKQLDEPALRVRVLLRTDPPGLSVCDDGSAVPDALLGLLMHAPVSSANGFGIGLYQSARLAASVGYRLVLAANTGGQVCFELRRERAGEHEGR